jgi:hypothetical protein
MAGSGVIASGVIMKRGRLAANYPHRTVVTAIFGIEQAAPGCSNDSVRRRTRLPVRQGDIRTTFRSGHQSRPYAEYSRRVSGHVLYEIGECMSRC